MKILHLISQTPDFTGSGKYIQAMLTQASARGHHNVLVAGARKGFSLPDHLIPKEHTRFVQFNTPELPYPLPGMSDAMPYPSTVFSCMGSEQIAHYRRRFIAEIQAAVQRFKPDIIHSHHLWIMTAAAADAVRHIPVVTTCHGTCLRQLTLCGDPDGSITRGCRRIRRIMALNRRQKDEIAERYRFPRDRIDIAGVGYDDTLFYPGKKGPHPPLDILYAGKLCQAKGVPWLLETLWHMRGLPWRLHLAGGGDGLEKTYCLELAARFKGQVFVHGPLSHGDLSDLMRRSHLFILPSFFEGMPLVLIEALACGCDLITTDLPGSLELLKTVPAQKVTWVHLPLLETVDRPYEQDKDALRLRLSGAIRHALYQWKKGRTESDQMETVSDITKQMTWQQVFRRVETVYENAQV